MNRILIIYPDLFDCFSKFNRKINKIAANLGEFELIYQSDPNGLIQQLTATIPNITLVKKCTTWTEEDITHAIVLDDGEEFPDEIASIKARKLPLRIINIPITRVINLKVDAHYQAEKSTSNYEYIGRGSYWGNPYSMYEDGEDREEVIRKYKYDFDYEKFPNKEKSEVYKLAGKRLGCFCKPQPCHGDVLASYLNAYDDGK